MLPALEVAIGLAVLFFVVALASSSIVEIIGTAFKLRAKGLETTVRNMLGEGDAEVATRFIESRVVHALREAEVAWTILGRPKRSRTIKIEEERKLPSQLPARAFAEGLVAVLTEVKQTAGNADDLFARLPVQLRERIQPMLDETGADLVALKARLEQWFDDSMHRLEDMYQKWSKKILFLVGLALTIMLNASALHIADRLWSNSAERAAVVAAVDDLVTDFDTVVPPTGTQNLPTEPAQSFSEVADSIGQLDVIGVPLGWADVQFSASWIALSALGWLVTALLVRLGAPFWYDILARLFALRKGIAAGATNDPASATSQITEETRVRTRRAYAQDVDDRAAPTPASNPADRLFAALPARA
jgi:hypothetical protein